MKMLPIMTGKQIRVSVNRRHAQENCRVLIDSDTESKALLDLASVAHRCVCVSNLLFKHAWKCFQT